VDHQDLQTSSLKEARQRRMSKAKMLPSARSKTYSMSVVCVELDNRILQGWRRMGLAMTLWGALQWPKRKLTCSSSIKLANSVDTSII
jgi:hypothetical protein